MAQKKWKGPGPDGANGYTADQGLRAVVGGEGIDEMNQGKGRMSPAEMRDYIQGAPTRRNVSYGDEARRFAKHLLSLPPKTFDGVCQKGGNFDTAGFDLTGFMYGWAVNAVRYVYSEPPAPNPAVMTWW
jgi:hypothetical protein